MTNIYKDSIELYPNIIVYKNLFKDANKNYETLKESTEGDSDRFFNYWSQWSQFGEYLNPTLLDSDIKIEFINDVDLSTKKQNNQKTVLVELLDNFNFVIRDYISRTGVDVDFNEKVINTEGHTVPRWERYGPSIVKYQDYSKTNTSVPLAMSYHSDFIRQPITSPGYKFAITVLTYFNDDYQGGEIDFAIGKELYKYKPEMGDIVVFPSGHPDVLTKDGNVYLHGVLPAKNGHKYLSRMYLVKYEEGSSEWFENEEKFGKEVWASMQNDIMIKFNEDNPQKREIKDGVRIK
jgi:hypothetical protein